MQKILTKKKKTYLLTQIMKKNNSTLEKYLAYGLAILVVIIISINIINI